MDDCRKCQTFAASPALRACIWENDAELALQRPRLLLNTICRGKGRRYSGFGEGEG